MSLDELLCVVRPPVEPVEAGLVENDSTFEKQIGIQLPNDYKQFRHRYGLGEFCDPDRESIHVFDLFSQDYREKIDRASNRLGSWGDEVPYRVHPEIPGLLPWGRDENGYSLYWLTEGSPDEWPVLALPPREHTDFERIDLSMTSFLAGSFSRRISTIIWGDPIFFSGPERVRFLPRGKEYSPYHAPAQWPSTVVQLAEALYYGEDSRFALHDYLLDAGHPELADHFRQSLEHPKCCWVLNMILGKQP